MPEKYYVECDCGKRIRVELFQAGSEKRCDSCNKSVPIPNTTDLKELSGDKYPLLRPIEKILRTLEEHEPPFDGVCHHCDEADAKFAIPISLDVMVERYVKHDGKIRPTITGGIALEVAESEEVRQEFTFPLLLCCECHTKYESTKLAAAGKNRLRLLGLLGLFIAFLVFAFFNAELVAALAGILWLIGAIAWATRFRHTQKVDSYITPWLDDIRWVPDALALEDEYDLTIGETESIE